MTPEEQKLRESIEASRAAARAILEHQKELAALCKHGTLVKGEVPMYLERYCSKAGCMFCAICDKPIFHLCSNKSSPDGICHAEDEPDAEGHGQYFCRHCHKQMWFPEDELYKKNKTPDSHYAECLSKGHIP